MPSGKLKIYCNACLTLDKISMLNERLLKIQVRLKSNCPSSAEISLNFPKNQTSNQQPCVDIIKDLQTVL